MTLMLSAENVASVSEWAERSEYWRALDAGAITTRRRRDRNTKPLILCGHGVSLRVHNGSLVIRDGFTHYPQEQVSHRFFCGDLSLPPRIILIDGSGTLSFDVLTCGIMHGAYRGKPGFVLDMMEPDRPKIDAAVLAFAQSETFTGSDFTIRSDGVCRLSPQLARRVVSMSAGIEPGAEAIAHGTPAIESRPL